MRCLIAVTRFNEKTYNENKYYRENNNIKGCIYGTSVPIKPEIKPEINIIILEMNNTKNKIMGIGLIKHVKSKRVRIYNQQEYNRFCYKGNKRIDHTNLTNLEKTLIKGFETIVFTTSQHMKRGTGITIIPEKKYSHTKLNDNGKIIKSFIENMFNKRYLFT